MAFPYQKHIWVTREIIRREYLQNIEDGIYDEQQDRLQVEGELSQGLTDEINARKNAVNGLDSRVQILEQGYTRAYKASGSIYFEDLPALTENRLGNVYDIKDDFVTTVNFIEGAGKEHPAGTNVAIVEAEVTIFNEVTPQGNENPSELGWYEYVDSEFVLSEDTTVDNEKTYYEAVEDIQLFYDVMDGFIDLSDYVQKTDYSTTSNYGVSKPDGVTILANNGVLSTAGAVYLDESVTLSTSAAVTATFTDSRIHSTSVIDVYTTVDGLEYASMTTTEGQCAVTFDEQETALSITVRIYIK